MRNRLVVLDVFRGLACLAVVLRHYTTIFRENYGLPFSKDFDFKYGYLGVQLFFMISGFVIFMSLEKTKSPFVFMKKRFLRLYPTYWLAIIITSLIVWGVGFNELKVDLVDTFVNFSMFQNFPAPFFTFKHVDGVYWSLTVEMFFYLMMAFLLKIKQLKNIKLIGFLWVLISVPCIYFDMSFLKIGVVLNFFWSPLFFAGIIFYIMWKDNKEKHLILNHLLILFSLSCYLFLNYTKHEYLLKSNTIDCLSGVLFFGMFYLFIYNKLDFMGNFKGILFIGKISYPWYLIHQNIGFIILFYFSSKFPSLNIFLLLLPIITTMSIANLMVTKYESFIRKMSTRL
jgi:peptidoglycan/LPS O-acetylase OafA/YrhL